MALIPRHIRPQLVEALAEARVACLLGARQSGKSTLVQAIARGEHPARYVTLDDPAALEVAKADPAGFVAGGERLAIDEIQRAPELMLAIKRVVDDDPTRGRFLLTGSANIVTHPRIADSLPGRVDYLTLWPFSQAELSESSTNVLWDAFLGDPPEAKDPPTGREGYVAKIVRGGFPEVVGSSGPRRQRFFAGYVDSILGREIEELGSVRDHKAAARVIRLAAARSAALVNLSSIAQELGIDHKTVGNHLRSLEQLFLLIRLPAWHANLGHRIVRSPKLHIADTGLLCSLIGAEPDRLIEDGGIAGSVFETFAVTEVIRMVDASDLAPQIRPHHYRDQRGHEVDLVLERANGDIVGIEVKASSTPRARDASGLALMRDALGKRFRLGLVLHTGSDTVPLGDRIWATPLASLWS